MSDNSKSFAFSAIPERKPDVRFHYTEQHKRLGFKPHELGTYYSKKIHPEYLNPIKVDFIEEPTKMAEPKVIEPTEDDEGTDITSLDQIPGFIRGAKKEL